MIDEVIMLAQLLVELLAIAPHAINDVTTAIAELRSSDTASQKVQTVATNIETLAKAIADATDSKTT